MANSLPSNVFVSMLIVAAFIIGGVFVFNGTLEANSQPIDQELNNSAFNNFTQDLDTFNEDFNTVVDQAPRGALQEITDYFNRAINIVTSFFKAPAVMASLINYISGNDGFNQIPTIIWDYILSIIIGIIIFAIVALYMRTKA